MVIKGILGVLATAHMGLSQVGAKKVRARKFTKDSEAQMADKNKCTFPVYSPPQVDRI